MVASIDTRAPGCARRRRDETLHGLHKVPRVGPLRESALASHRSLHAWLMQVPRTPAIGHQSVVKQLRSVLFSEVILAAATVRPKGFMKVAFAPLFGWWAPILARRATDPFPPTILYLAVTPVDIRLFSKPGLSSPYEIGRWKRGSYRASVGESAVSLKIDLELERLGRVRLFAGKNVRPVIDLVVQGAAGPAI
jgi:hypothetical protein